MRGGFRLWWIVVLSIACIAVIWPLFRPGFYTSDDGTWMIIRLSAFYQSWAEGHFPVRYLGRLFFSYGYPVANFLYPGFLYLGSVLHGFGLSFVDSVKFILGGAVFSGGVACFLWLRSFYNQKISLLGAVTWIWSPYLLYDLYVRGSVGEVMALASLMWALYTLEAKYWRRFVVAATVLVLAHNTLALFGTVIICGYIILRRREATVWWFLSLGLSAFFWLPAIIEQRYIQFSDISVSQPARYVWEGQTKLILTAVYLLAAIWLITVNKKRTVGLMISSLSVIGAGFLASSWSGFLWSNRIAQLVQFPYRFLAIIVTIGPWCMAAAFSKLSKKRGIILMFFVLGMFGYQTWVVTKQVDQILEPEGYYSTNEASTTVADEYLPRTVRVKPSARSVETVEVYHGKAEIKLLNNAGNDISFVADVSEPAEVQINKFYYPGWGALVNDQPVNLNINNPHGLMRLQLPLGKNKVRVVLRETVLRFIADVISAGCGLLFAVSIWPLINKRKAV